MAWQKPPDSGRSHQPEKDSITFPPSQGLSSTTLALETPDLSRKVCIQGLQPVQAVDVSVIGEGDLHDLTISYRTRMQITRLCHIGAVKFPTQAGRQPEFLQAHITPVKLD